MARKHNPACPKAPDSVAREWDVALEQGLLTVVKHAGMPYLLKGKLFDSAGDRMTPSHSVKKDVRYRYNDTQAILDSRPGEAGRIGRVSALHIASMVTFTRAARVWQWPPACAKPSHSTKNA
jgi:hypothetical protein